MPNIRSGQNIHKIFKVEIELSSLVCRKSSGLLAVSGGVDSVVMAHLFLSLKEELGLNLGIIHFNHRFRKKDSDKDERFVKNLADSIGFPFFLEKWNFDGESNFEARARKARYTFFETKRSEMSYDWISTAHHADDQSETILMRLIDGSSYRGLKGIPKEKGKLFRPLLGFSKEELINYAKENSLQYRYDLTNDDNRFDRNRIRNTIIPNVKNINPNFNKTVGRTIRNFKEINDLIDQEVRVLYSKSVSISEEGFIQVNHKIFKDFPLLIQKELIKCIVDHDDKLWRGHIWDELHNFLLHASVGNLMTILDKIRILKDRDYLLISKVPTEKNMKVFPVHSSLPIDMNVGAYKFTMAFADSEIFFTKDPSIELIDYKRLKGPLCFRRWQEGDRMIPLGMNGQKKVSDILINEKINRFNKENQYILTSADEIVWLCGLRLDDRYKVSGDTSSVVVMNWRKD